MRRIRYACLLTLLTVLLPAAEAQAQGYRTLEPVAGVDAPETRVALVIGNSRYAHAASLCTPDGRQCNPSNDAEDMAEALRQVGFTVVTGIDLSHEAMDRAVGAFADRLQGAEVGLFFYAGHGVEVDGENYLIPVDAEIRQATQVKYRAVSAAMVLEMMDAAGSTLNMLVLDACRDNPFRSWRSSRSGLAAMNGPGGSIIAYATGPGTKASNNLAGRNGLYTSVLLEHLQQEGVEVSRLLRRVSAEVRRRSGGKQEPWMAASYGGDFFFRMGEAPPPSTPPPSTPPLPAEAVTADLDAGTRLSVVSVPAGEAAFPWDRCATEAVADVDGPAGSRPAYLDEEFGDDATDWALDRIVVERGGRRVELDARCLGYTTLPFDDEERMPARAFRVAREDANIIYLSTQTHYGEGEAPYHLVVAWELLPQGSRRLFVGTHHPDWVAANVVALARGLYRPSSGSEVALPALAPPPVPPSQPASCDAWGEGEAINVAYFQPGETALDAEAETALEENAALLTECPAWCVRVQGRSLNIEYDGLNRAVERAKAVRRYYVEQGVAPGRILGSALLLESTDPRVDRRGYEPDVRNLRASTELMTCPSR